MTLSKKFLPHFKRMEAELDTLQPPTISSLKRQAFACFEKLQLPTSKNENWKYTNLHPLFAQGIEPLTSPSIPESIAFHAFPFMKTNRLVFIDGVYSKHHSHLSDRHITVTSLKSELLHNNPLLNQYLGKATSFESDALIALNTSFAHDGAFIHIPAHSTSHYPILLIYASSGLAEKAIIQPRNLIIAENHTHTTIIESYQNATGKQTFINKVTEIFLHNNALLNFYKLIINEPHYYHIGTTAVQMKNDARLESYTIHLGGKLTRNNLLVKLDGMHAEANLYGAYVLNNDDHIDNHIEVEHATPSCQSNQLYKGLLDDKSTGVFHGKIIVKRNAQKTNAYQSNKNMLLSEKATMNAKPQLEIFADDVKCSHGATIGQIDKNALFYLKSRGIDDATARLFIYQAFIGEVLEKVKIEPLKNYLLEKLHEKFKEDS